MNARKQKRQLPLLLTVGRIFFGPVFAIFYLLSSSLAIPSFWLPYVLLLLIMLGELSDVLDGAFARRYDMVSTLGKILDPMADSLFRLSIFFSFTQGIVGLPLLLVLLLLYRDILVTTLRTLCALQGITLAARSSGKIKAVFQAIVIFTIVFLMIPYSWGAISLELFQQISFCATFCVVIYTIFSGAEYFWAHRATIRRLTSIG